MAMLPAFTTQEKTYHNSHKFAFTLSPTNYGFWKTMIYPFLLTNNMFGYIDGSIPCPDETLPAAATASTAGIPGNNTRPNPNYATWLANDAHVRMLLISTISEASFHHVQGDTSRDLWNTLERAYAPHTTSREFTLKTQLLKIEMKGDETPSAYLTRAQSLATTLSNIDEPMKDKDLVMLVISGLREEYNGLKSNLLGRQTPTTFNELSGLLSDHDFLINKNVQVCVTNPPPLTAMTAATPACSNSTTSANLLEIQQLAAQLGYHLTPSRNSQANFTSRSNSNQRGRGFRGRGRGQPQNRQSFNGPRGQFDWASNTNTVYGTCNRCGIGHIPSQCPNRDPSTRPRPTANFSEHRQAPPSTWFPDTGANSHVTPDLASLGQSEAYTGDDALHVGNGHIYTQYPSHGSK